MNLSIKVLIAFGLLANIAAPSFALAKQAPKKIATEVYVRAWCPVKGVSEVRSGPTFEVAKDRAVQACLDHGGTPNCCTNFYKEIRKPAA